MIGRRSPSRPKGLSMWKGAPMAAAGALVAASCGAPLLKLPVGPTEPASDGREAVLSATAACRVVSTITLEVAVRGSIAGRAVRGRLSAGLASPAFARLEAVASFGQPVFIFVARNEDATLVLSRDRRVLEHGRPEAVLEAIAGVPVDASRLRLMMTGCAATTDAAGARKLGDSWRIVPDGDNDAYIRRNSAAAPWQLVATVHQAAGGGWRAEYRDFLEGLPRTVRVASVPAGRFDLTLALTQVDINTALAGDVFRVQIPAAADPISLDELRQSGPLGAR